jgi:hypothetical protein
VDPSVEARFAGHLESDLASGTWDRTYGDLRTQPEFVGALRLVTALPGRT